MARARCRECGGHVSSEAVSCPHCGTQNPASAAAPAGAAHAHPADAHPPGRRRGRGGRILLLLLLLAPVAAAVLWYTGIVPV